MRIWARCLLVVWLLSLSACSEQSDDVVAFVEKVKNTAAGQIKSLPQAKPVNVEQYTAEALRSPFDQSVVKEENVEQPEAAEETSSIKQQPRPDLNRTRYFLEKYPLKNFIMVGTLKKQNTTWGLVEDETGLVHVIKVGDYIGQNSGKVKSISENAIYLVETVPDGVGGWMQVNSEIDLALE